MTSSPLNSDDSMIVGPVQRLSVVCLEMVYEYGSKSTAPVRFFDSGELSCNSINLHELAQAS